MNARRISCLAVLLVWACSVVPVAAESPAGMRLYVLNTGSLSLSKGWLLNGGPMEPKIRVPVAFFVIKHPKGNVLFDTGNNDKIITDPSYWGPNFAALKPVNTPEISIEAQLGRVGMKPDDFSYVVVSHMHLDHGGNVGKFPNSTIVLQEDARRDVRARGRRHGAGPGGGPAGAGRVRDGPVDARRRDGALAPPRAGPLQDRARVVRGPHGPDAARAGQRDGGHRGGIVRNEILIPFGGMRF